ncbi:Transcriptional regulator TACO1-like domain 2 [Penicillium macrosclerotiorum]|uniref:Transcriptional regulator TACO1-like domain 2 n=1 Tax=Penicillium macrosclerotiorum TaxID=303699 RepID=UPI002546D5AD|nr:Transcriptional regulator TACO1-like domain 2 [Penicillium macrosclerotiorum]KAJ5669328.1 Transcriptional regulator TACO1-like domain 2 [Penicillium macrosclerotiorum]
MALQIPRLLRQPRVNFICRSCLSFHTSSLRLSGHSKWSTIKHDKAKNDKAKSKDRQVMSKEISSATQLWGPDPKFNPRLTLALSNAKRASIPKAIIEAALLRGQGLSVTGQTLESLTIEAMLPGGVAAVVECQTDQKARVLQDVRYLIKNGGGTVTPTTFLFEKKGRVIMEQQGLNMDDYLDQAIEAGATDITTDDKGRLVVFTDPSETKNVGETFSKLSGLTIEEREIFWDPNQETMVDVQDELHVKALEDLLGALRDDPSVQDIYLNSSEKF